MAKLPSFPRLNKRRILRVAGITALLAGAGVLLALYASPKPSLTGDAPQSTTYTSRDGALLRLELATDDRYRLFTKLPDIPDALVEATLLQEDKHFYAHPGVNPFSLFRAAFETYVTRTRPVGGSTITMQLVRLRDKLNTRTIPGKITQIWRALVLERHFAKPEILEAYLNLAPYGGNIEGVGAAARIYFAQKPANLALPQSLALAVIPQNPVRRDPLGGDNAAWREARMRLFERYATSNEQAAAQRRLMEMPLVVHNRDDLPYLAPHLINGLTSDNAANVTTTLDLHLQAMLEKHLQSYVRQNGISGIDNAAAMIVDARDMGVRALVGSAGFFRDAIDGQVDGTAALRSPGSTLKSFVYALALEQGLIHPKSLLEDAASAFAEYRPANFDHRFMGRIPADQALQMSRNVPAIALAAKLGQPDLYSFLQSAGLGLAHDKGHYGLSLVVGGAEVTMRDLVRLYAMLANGGKLADLRFTKAATGATTKQMLSPEAAYLTLMMLERPFARDETAFAVSEQSLPVYWKTGTSSGMRDAWTVGVFGPYVMAVWVGHFDGRRNPALVGSNIAAPLYFDIANAVIAAERPADRIHDAVDALGIKQVALCGTSPARKSCAQPVQTFFIAGKSPITERQISREPQIISPQEGVSYALPQSQGDADNFTLPLEARFDKPAYPLYWFAGKKLIGVSEKGGAMFWRPRPGDHVIRVLDSRGKSAATAITVVSAR